MSAMNQEEIDRPEDQKRRLRERPKALIIVADGVQDQEFIVPLFRLQEAGYSVTVATHKQFDMKGILGVPMQASVNTHELRDSFNQFDILILPGGAKAIERLRQDPYTLAIIQGFKGVIGSMCSAAHLLISAKIVKGRRISGYYALKDDIENAGAEFVDAPFVVDGNIVSSPHYRHLGPWMGAVLRQANIMQAYRDARGTDA